MASNQDGDLPTLLTVGEVAQILKISQRSIWRLVASGQLIKPLHVGGSIRWRQDELATWLDNGCPDVTPTRNAKGDGLCSP